MWKISIKIGLREEKGLKKGSRVSGESINDILLSILFKIIVKHLLFEDCFFMVISFNGCRICLITIFMKISFLTFFSLASIHHYIKYYLALKQGKNYFPFFIHAPVVK
jgi:hypothetical protein